MLKIYYTHKPNKYKNNTPSVYPPLPENVKESYDYH